MIHFYKVKYKYKYIIGEKFKKEVADKAKWNKSKSTMTKDKMDH